MSGAQNIQTGYNALYLLARMIVFSIVSWLVYQKSKPSVYFKYHSIPVCNIWAKDENHVVFRFFEKHRSSKNNHDLLVLEDNLTIDTPTQ